MKKLKNDFNKGKWIEEYADKTTNPLITTIRNAIEDYSENTQEVNAEDITIALAISLEMCLKVFFIKAKEVDDGAKGYLNDIANKTKTLIRDLDSIEYCFITLKASAAKMLSESENETIH